MVSMPKLLKSITVLLLVLLGCSPEPPQPMANGKPSANSKRVLFLAGQSNAIAQEGTSAPPGFPDPSIELLAKSLGPDGFVFETPAPVPLGLVNGYRSLELTAARDLQAADDEVSVVKVARGGSWLGEWLPDSPTGYWGELVAEREKAIAAWGLSEAEWSFVWFQSESDTALPEYAEAYEENLRKFVGNVRGVFGDVHFYQCKLQPARGSKSGTGTTVRAAQVKVMSESPLNHLLDFDDLNGALHYTPDQLDELGRRTAAAILANE